MKMHKNEVPIDVDMVKYLLQTQFPEFCKTERLQLEPGGTVNVVYRFGSDLCVRLPRTKQAESALMSEVSILRSVFRGTTLMTPEPVFVGSPGEAYPFNWTVYRWIDGSNFELKSCKDENEIAEQLAGFVYELKTNVVVEDWRRAGRVPLLDLDASAKDAIEQCGSRINQVAVMSIWKKLIQTAIHDGERYLIHADLLPTNLLMVHGKLNAVIDFGSAGLGDPSFDLIPAWSTLGRVGRKRFQEVLWYDDSVWQRAKRYALYQALLIVPYYWKSFSEFSQMALRTIREVIED